MAVIAGQNLPPRRVRTGGFAPMQSQKVEPAAVVAVNSTFQDLYDQIARLEQRIYDLENPKGR